MKEKIITFVKRICDLLAPYKKNIIIPALKILGVIILCALIARYMGGHETLLEYAAKNGK